MAGAGALRDRGDSGTHQVAFIACSGCASRSRGQFEKQSVLGQVLADEPNAPVSMEAAFERILRIRTIKDARDRGCSRPCGFGALRGPRL